MATVDAELKVRDANDDLVGLTVGMLTGGTLVAENYDHVALGYTGDDLTTVTYRLGGSGGTVVATVTLAYTDGRLTSVTVT